MKSIEEITAALKAQFPESAVSWRAQTFKGDGTAAMALCYIDARDVMNRFDEVCGAFGWQVEHIVSNGGAKVTCKISIKNPETGEWVSKSDGAGETDVEGEKGSYSDSLKRAAVQWGVGRYLYDRDAVWCECEAYKNDKGKWVFKAWKGDPSGKIKQPEPKPAKSIFANASLRKTYVEYCINSYEQAETVSALNALIENDKGKFKEMRDAGNEHDILAVDELQKRYRIKLGELKQVEILSASFNQGFNEAGASA